MYGTLRHGASHKFKVYLILYYLIKFSQNQYKEESSL